MAKVAQQHLEVEWWAVTERGFREGRSLAGEPLFTLSNEYMGVGGYFEVGLRPRLTLECFGSMTSPTCGGRRITVGVMDAFSGTAKVRARLDVLVIHDDDGCDLWTVPHSGGDDGLMAIRSARLPMRTIDGPEICPRRRAHEH
ncbi:MAG: hypothetical protein GVY16_07195 [Planctomycetes bacterium]|jgi:hypothetical protein|nr:hypothetical protein [Phycisphaerae bacterium]NBB95511.1 hypothetical protein [Planctomycetota bacterium]